MPGSAEAAVSMAPVFRNCLRFMILRKGGRWIGRTGFAGAVRGKDMDTLIKMDLIRVSIGHRAGTAPLSFP